MSTKVPLSLPFVCRKPVPLVPDLTPVISNLSNYSSNASVYTVVTIYGNNFGPSISTVNFVNNNYIFTNIPVTFYNSKEISFSVPSNAFPGDYSLTVVNRQAPYVNMQKSLFLVSNSVPFTVFV